MTKTRNLLNQLNGVIIEYNLTRAKLITHSVGNNENLLNSNNQEYILKIAKLDEEIKNTCCKMLEQHIDYLKKDAPYGRKLLDNTPTKQNLLLTELNKIKQLPTDKFINKLSASIEELKLNQEIDKPRWSNPDLSSLFNFFKSILPNITTDSQSKHNKKHR